MADYTVEIVVKCEGRDVVHVTESFVARDDSRALVGLRGWIETILHHTNWHVAAAETKHRRTEQ